MKKGSVFGLVGFILGACGAALPPLCSAHWAWFLQSGMFVRTFAETFQRAGGVIGPLFYGKTQKRR